MYSIKRTKQLAGLLVAVASGLTGVALAHREPGRCARGPAAAPRAYLLPEVEVIAQRLPPG